MRPGPRLRKALLRETEAALWAAREGRWGTRRTPVWWGLGTVGLSPALRSESPSEGKGSAFAWSLLLAKSMKKYSFNVWGLF